METWNTFLELINFNKYQKLYLVHEEGSKSLETYSSTIIDVSQIICVAQVLFWRNKISAARILSFCVAAVLLLPFALFGAVLDGWRKHKNNTRAAVKCLKGQPMSAQIKDMCKWTSMLPGMDFLKAQLFMG